MKLQRISRQSTVLSNLASLLVSCSRDFGLMLDLFTSVLSIDLMNKQFKFELCYTLMQTPSVNEL